MIQIYNATNEDFTRNGDITLLPIVAEVDATINGTWRYNLRHAVDDLGRWKYIETGAVIKAPSFNGDQLFRIKNVNKNETEITADAEPIFLDAKDDFFITNKRIVNQVGSRAIKTLIGNNPKYGGESDIAVMASVYFYYVNLIEAINGNQDNTFINRYGGEILYDNFIIRIYSQIGEDNGIELRYGKNIPVKGFEEITDTKSVITRIYPTAYNGYTMTNNGYVDSPLIDKYPVVYSQTIRFEDVKMRVDAQEGDEERGIIICNSQVELDYALTVKCRERYNAGVDKPTVTIKSNMVLLQDVVGYEEYSDLVTVGLGDTVHCYHSKLGIISDARVTRLKYDSITEKVTEVTLTNGEEYDYFKNVSQVVDQTKKAFSMGANGAFLFGDKTVKVEKGIITEIV